LLDSLLRPGIYCLLCPRLRLRGLGAGLVGALFPFSSSRLDYVANLLAASLRQSNMPPAAASAPEGEGDHQGGDPGADVGEASPNGPRSSPMHGDGAGGDNGAGVAFFDILAGSGVGDGGGDHEVEENGASFNGGDGTFEYDHRHFGDDFNGDVEGGGAYLNLA
jgi:hypothetical protein